MVTIKAYTDLEQSRKLSEFLSVESADMYYDRYGTPSFIDKYVTHESIKSNKYHDIIPCWSLAALLCVLPAHRFEIFYFKEAHEYNIYAEFDKYHSNIGVGENIVDACYKLILKLHELNLL